MLGELHHNITCPRCQASAADGLALETLTCGRCGLQFFILDGMPCLFPAGREQRKLWEALLATLENIRGEAQTTHDTLKASLGNLTSTRHRMQAHFDEAQSRKNVVIKLLRQATLRPQLHDAYRSHDPKNLVQYMELMLRDWGWQPMGENHGVREYIDENQQAFDRVKSVLDALPENAEIQSVLVIGSGAGRLSWDVHCELKNATTVAVDSNPLLAYTAHNMIKQQGEIRFLESTRFPEHGLPDNYEWKLSCPKEPLENLHQTWHMLAGDAWALPFAKESFDLIITPWFLDINGRDAKELMAVVDKLLKPTGLWLNSGPLLYPDELPSNQQYTPDEIRELLKLGEFTLLSEGFDEGPYTHSPFVVRGRTEQVWSFMAQQQKGKRAGVETVSEKISQESVPAWLILPYLPAPKLNDNLFPAELHNITSLFDGERSINDVADIIAQSMEPGFDAKGMLFELFEGYLFL